MYWWKKIDIKIFDFYLDNFFKRKSRSHADFDGLREFITLLGVLSLSIIVIVMIDVCFRNAIKMGFDVHKSHLDSNCQSR